jgi:DHA1 family multidrug resistance protein-like MFS transporter
LQDWQQTLRVLWLVQFLTTLAMNLGLTFVPFYLAEDPVLRVESDSARAVYTGLILAGPFFTTIVFTPLWGWVADRTGPKQQVVRACLGLGLTQLLMAVAQSADQMVIIRMVQGMISGVLAACLGLIAVVTPNSHQGRAIAVLQSATPAGQIFGPLLGGVLAVTMGFRFTYALLGGVILITGLLCWLLLRQKGFVPKVSPNPFVGLWGAARRALKQPLLRQAFGILVLGQFAFTVAQAVLAIYAGKLIAAWVAESGAVPAWWNTGVGFTAMVMTLTGTASVLSSAWWGWLHDARVPFLTPIGATLMAVSMLVLVFWPPWWVVLLSRLGTGAGIAPTSTLQYAIISGGADPAERSQSLGLATALTHLGNLIGFVLGGILAAWWAEAGNFAVAAGCYVLIGIATLQLEIRLRQAKPASARSSEDANLPTARQERIAVVGSK